MELRDYQKDLVARIGAEFSRGIRRVCAVAPCGAGKTVVVGWMAGNTAACGRRVLFLVHRRELIDQASRTFSALGIRHGIISAGTTPNYDEAVQVASVQTVARRLHKIQAPDFIIIDEAHHAVAGTWRRVLDAFPEAWVLGVTATPARLDGAGLGDVFEALVIGPDVNELIGRRNLSAYDYYAPPGKADVAHVRIRFGEFVRSDLSAVVDDDAVIGDTVMQYHRLANGKQAVCYCVTLEHSRHVAERFRKAGIAAEHIDGDTPKLERDRIIRDFRTKKIRVLCNVDLLGEGLDVPGMEAVILARPTASLTLFIQQAMRPLRPDANNPDKRAVIIDQAGNCFRHGLPNEVHEWSLADKPKKKQVREIKIHQCDKCFQVWDTATLTCPYCGYRPQVSMREVNEQDGELAKIDDLELLRKRKRKEEVRRARTREELERIACERGYRFGWVRKMMELKRIRA